MEYRITFARFRKNCRWHWHPYGKNGYKYWDKICINPSLKLDPFEVASCNEKRCPIMKRCKKGMLISITTQVGDYKGEKYD